MLEALHGGFSRQFQDLKILSDMVSSPFNSSMDNTPSDVKLELIDLQSDTSGRTLQVGLTAGLLLLLQRGQFSTCEEACSEDSITLWVYLWVYLFTHYVCEQTFPMMKVNKVTDDHLLAVLCIATSDLLSNFNAVVEAPKRLDYFQ